MDGMDTLKMEAVLNNYKKLLGNKYKSQIDERSLQMLNRVTGDMNFITHMGFLLNIVEYIEKKGRNVEETVKTDEESDNAFLIALHKQWLHDAEDENDKLTESNNELNEKIKLLERIIDTYNKCHLQQVKLKNGEKIAYKKQATLEKVSELKKSGLGVGEIAETLCVSKATVYRRLKESV